MLFITLTYDGIILIGYIVGSLALIADAYHMLNDTVSLGIALYAIRVRLALLVRSQRLEYSMRVCSFQNEPRTGSIPTGGFERKFSLHWLTAYFSLPFASPSLWSH